MKIDQDKLVYVIISPKGDIDLDTIHRQRKGCISSFVGEYPEDFKDLQKQGWKCKKVELTLRNLNNFDLWG